MLAAQRLASSGHKEAQKSYVGAQPAVDAAAMRQITATGTDLVLSALRIPDEQGLPNLSTRLMDARAQCQESLRQKGFFRTPVSVSLYLKLD